MPRKKHPVVWSAAPHTIAKITILRSYLAAWFAIMGRTKRGQDLLYVDGFAGPGEYANYPMGSPIAALHIAQDAIVKSGAEWRAGDVHYAFIEQQKQTFAHLQEQVQSFQSSARVHVHLLNSSFVDGMAALKTLLPDAFTKSFPLFVFIDPFGPTAVPFSTVAEILSSGCSEVLINLDADGIARIFKAKEQAKSEAHLDAILPDKSWREMLSEDLPFAELCKQVLELYKAGLRNLPSVRYVFAFEMQGPGGALNYYLVFASQHPLGLEKMKEAMRSIDKTGEYRFSDARAGQATMFRFDDPVEFSQRLFEQFKGRKVKYSELHNFALNETPFTNPKSMLKELESQQLIKVQSRDPKRRKGTFNEQTLQYIEFARGG